MHIYVSFSFDYIEMYMCRCTYTHTHKYTLMCMCVYIYKSGSIDKYTPTYRWLLEREREREENILVTFADGGGLMVMKLITSADWISTWLEPVALIRRRSTSTTASSFFHSFPSCGPTLTISTAPQAVIISVVIVVDDELIA